MIKLISCWRRLPDVSLKDFEYHWSAHHSHLCSRVKPLRRCVQYPVEGRNPMSRQALSETEPFDGFEATWWDSFESFQRATAEDSDWAAVRADRNHFVDASRSTTCLVDEQIITEPEGLAECVLVECHSHPPCSRRQLFQVSWLRIHGDFGRRIQAMGVMSGYIQNHVVSDVDPIACMALGLEQDRYDGIGMAYFESLPILQSMAKMPVVTDEAFRAEHAFTDPKHLVSLLARRRTIKTLIR